MTFKYLNFTIHFTEVASSLVFSSDISWKLQFSPVFLNSKVESSTRLGEGTPQVHQWRRQNLFLEIPSRTVDVSSQDGVMVKVPITPSPTPRRVNFLLTPDSNEARLDGSPGPPSSSRGKSSIRGLLTKLSFKYRASTPVDIERGSEMDPEASSTINREKSSISRSLSLTKLFTPRMKRTSSLPATSLADSNPGSSRGGSVSGVLNFGASWDYACIIVFPLVYSDMGSALSICWNFLSSDYSEERIPGTDVSITLSPRQRQRKKHQKDGLFLPCDPNNSLRKGRRCNHQCFTNCWSP